MANKAKAGCPYSNVQATLDGLTSQGLSVAVYEELLPSTSPKTRGLSQIVFPGASTYIYNLSLRQDNIEFRENCPVIGVMKTLSGYTLCQGYFDEQSIDVSERLTMETVRVLIRNSGYVEPIYVQNVDKDLFGADIVTEKLSGNDLIAMFSLLVKACCCCPYDCLYC